MKTNTNKITDYLLIIFIISFLAFSCDSAGPKKKINQQNTVSAYDSAQGKSFTYSKYEMPLSVDVYKFLKSKKTPFNGLLMHKLREQDKYFTDIKRAFVLGIYSSDLAYAAIYEQSQDAVDYFGASIELAHKLNIQDGYNSQTLDRAYDNLNNEDSLTYIAGESYWRTCSSLEKSNRENILPMVVVGSWIESMHVLTRNCIGSPPESGIFNELYLQLQHLKKLNTYLGDALTAMKSSDSKNELQKLVNKLNIIQQKYEGIDGSKPAEFGLGQFKEVIFLIEDLRNEMLE